MSDITVDRLTYQRMFLIPLVNELKNDAIAALIDDGFDLVGARQHWRHKAMQLAVDQLASDGIFCDTRIIIAEHQADTDEYREEMSLGGQPYKIP